MGVQGLWDLVAPAGRRVKIQTLEGKVLAIDVSIWLIRMLHGSVSLGKNEFKNIHLVGIMRRIIKLMFYGIKPVFVFDGKFPELKRETVQKRQAMRENRKRNLKKIAEKYLTKILEERIKETIGRVHAPKKRQSSENKPPLNFGEDEEVYLENEEEKEQRKKREQDQREREEAQAAGHDDAMLYDYEFDLIVEENKELLIENGIDLDEFNKQDSTKQYDTIKKVRNKMRERKMKNYLAIDSLDEFSKVHVKDYVKHCKRKLKLEKSKEEANTKRLAEEKDNVLGNVKYSDMASNEYMRNLFLDPKKNVMQGALASNRNKGFIYMVQKDKKFDNQVLKLGNKRQNKFERLKKLNLKLKEIAQNAESGPSFFSYDELLCDNPLDAFKHHTEKVDPISARNNLTDETNEDLNNINDDSQQNIDVDEVFGFNDWVDNEENRDPSSDSQSENQEAGRQEYEKSIEVEEKEQGRQEQLPTIVERVAESDEDLFDLFEYKVEEKLETKISPKATQYKPSFIDIAKQEKVENFADKISIEKMHVEKIMNAELRDVSPEVGKRVQVKSSKNKASIIKEDILEEYCENILGTQNNKDMGKKSVEKKTNFSVYRGAEMKTPEDKGSWTASTKNTVLKFSPESERSDRDETATTKKSFFGRLKYEGKTSPAQEGKSHLGLIQELVEEPTQKKSKTSADQDKREEILTKRVILGLDNTEGEKIEEEVEKTSKPIFLKKGTVEDPCVVDEKADLFWRRNSGRMEDKKEKNEKKSQEKKSKEKEKEIEVTIKEEPVKVEVKEEEIIEIQYEKPGAKKTKTEVKENSKEEQQSTPLKPPGEVNQDSNKFSVGSQEENFEDMDEAKLLEQMKELEENETLDKWALMEQFQKFQNLNELEGDSIQERLREIKELLIMFGIPWVESPAEAEAQCAFLELSGLVDGVVTDDSDVFLFGARHVYRNIFDKGDFVYSYPMRYVENELILDRSKLILMALFLGSDYTLGIKGVGIVNAMEIVRAFETPEALERFKDWAELPDVLMEDASTHYKNIPVKELEYKLYHRNFKKHWELPDNFPDKRVIEAYEKPLVDLSQEKFEWGVPDVENLEGLCKNRFKWDQDRINNTLEPLKKAMKERTGQKKITDFFREEKIAVINSKRMNQSIAAVQDKKGEENEMAMFTEVLQKKLDKQNHHNLKKKRTEDDIKGEEELEGFAYRKKPKRTTTL